ncbi:HPr family phosphocarrier protein [Caproiciproducens galactitolivorans]|uniref:Phosphocarrier protein HPr n=1 Tax=Caproiciproducens galactitolivorans TaxID=642589 RepID=A0A4Z0Y8F4_9FIRM|nr:HPr family phosphocarrier protein [Caproiciproducens galactitolivorans]QEY34854.1 HPr family phosphocarrier protein [Caproiciproducens galactitolivorans]TGJ75561.1 phosphocarrier protein HPr [Caproiciproducens galactitolivorans]
MKTIQYTITATDGLHARPAGLLAKCAQELDSEIIITCGGKSANAKKLFSIMALSVKEGDTIEIAVSGKNEEQDIKAIGDFCRENL